MLEFQDPVGTAAEQGQIRPHVDRDRASRHIASQEKGAGALWGPFVAVAPHRVHTVILAGEEQIVLTGLPRCDGDGSAGLNGEPEPCRSRRPHRCVEDLLVPAAVAPPCEHVAATGRTDAARIGQDHAAMRSPRRPVADGGCHVTMGGDQTERAIAREHIDPGGARTGRSDCERWRAAYRCTQRRTRGPSVAPSGPSPVVEPILAG